MTAKLLEDGATAAIPERLEVAVFLVALTVILAFTATLAAAVQPPPVQWQRTIPGSGYGSSIQQTADGGYVIAGDKLIRTDDRGIELWREDACHDLHGQFVYVQEASDGGFILTGWSDTTCCGGEGGDIILIKTDELGRQLRPSNLGGSSCDFTSANWFQKCAISYYVEVAVSGGYLVLGLTSEYRSENGILTADRDGFLIRTSISGVELWRTPLGIGDMSSPLSVDQTEDGGYLVVVLASELAPDLSSVESGAYYLYKIDSQGSIVWERPFQAGDPIPSWEAARTLLLAGEGEYIAVGAEAPPGQEDLDILVCRFDNQGNRVWEMYFGGDNDDRGTCIRPTADGGWIIMGNEETPSGGWDIYLIKLGPDPGQSHTVGMPTTPSGPPTGQVGAALPFSTGGATCTQGHAVQYQFRWGDGTPDSSWSLATTASHSYATAGTYQVTARARCSQDVSRESSWSSAKSVTVLAVPVTHTVSAPTTPSGPPSGQVGAALPFSTGGSTCSQGHSVQYQFRWGDGTPDSSWSLATTVSHSYATAGTYQVTARARCSQDVSRESSWSSAKSVTVLAVPVTHTVSAPTTPSGPPIGQVGATLPFSTGGSTCSQGHSVQYQFRWGDGTPDSSWSSATTVSHSYAAAGTYQVKARARCSQVTSVESDWSMAKSVTVSTGPVAHTVSVPTTPSGPPSGQVGAALPFSTGGSTCSQGHAVQYQFDWNDETPYSSWSSAATASHSYASAGTFYVRAQARCASASSVTSTWSEGKETTIQGSPAANGGFWTEVTNTPLGKWRIREGHSLSASVLRVVPNGWVIWVVDTYENAIQDDGYIWWEVGDSNEECDGCVRGWMAAASDDLTAVYLVGDAADTNQQERLQSRSDPFFVGTAGIEAGESARREVLMEAVEHYFTDASSTSSLYSSGDNSFDGSKNSFQMFSDESNGFPRAVFLAMLVQESGDFRFDNQVYGMDTAGDYLNGGVGIAQVTGTANRGWGSSLKCYDDACARADREDLHVYPGGSRYRHSYYSNSVQGIYANIKDGLRVLQWAFGFVGRDVAKAVWRYNGGLDYVHDVRDRLTHLGEYFPGLDTKWIDEAQGSLPSAYNAVRVRSPVDLVVYDSQGRAVGSEDGEELREVPDSDFLEDRIVLFDTSQEYRYVIRGRESGTYGIEVIHATSDAVVAFTGSRIPVDASTSHEFTIDWDVLAQGGYGVTLRTDANGDGSYEDTELLGPDFDAGGEPGETHGQAFIACGPNPVTRSGTAFLYSLPENAGSAELVIHSPSGRLVARLPLDIGSSRFPSAGYWLPMDDAGMPLANGPYLCVLLVDGRVAARGKMVVQR